MAIKFSDLSDFDTVADANKGACLTLLNKLGNPTDKKIWLLGTDSNEWRNMEHSDANLRMKAAQKSGKAIKFTSEQIEEIGLRRLAAVTIKWEGFVDESGNPAICNKENAFALFSAMPHIARQVENFVLDPANFGQEGEKQSPLTVESYMGEIAGNSQAGQSMNTAASLSSGNA